jgi:hypothetical protein
MTTNVPQDVIELAKQAGFDVDDDGDIWGSENGSLLRFAELLRAQRQQGAEPVYTNTEHGVTMQERNFSYDGNGWIQDNNFDYDAGWKVTGDFIGDDKDQYCQMICDALNSYTTPPQANALVAAAYRNAAEICDECVSFKMAEWSSPQARPLNHEEIKSRLLEAIPADAEAALRELIADAVAAGADNIEGYDLTNIKPWDDVVNSVLGEGK